MNERALFAAKKFIDSYFPNCSTAFLGGSISLEAETEHSDLDLVILTEDEPMTSQRCFVEFGWSIETFVYNPHMIHVFLESDSRSGNPLLLRICANGIILKGGVEAEELKEDAQGRLEEGPPEWNQNQINLARYTITDLLYDFIGSENPTESIFVVNLLAIKIHEFILRTNRQWTGEGKWLVRSLKNFDPQLAEDFIQSFESFYADRKKEPIITFVDETLKPHGGRLFNGYNQPLF
ncbi:nucleotidyltransferase domain-containing protein [Bacillaceae bacterium S4-13-56]